LAVSDNRFVLARRATDSSPGRKPWGGIQIQSQPGATVLLLGKAGVKNLEFFAGVFREATGTSPRAPGILGGMTPVVNDLAGSARSSRITPLSET